MDRTTLFRKISRRPPDGGVFASPQFPKRGAAEAACRLPPVLGFGGSAASGDDGAGGTGLWIDHRKAVVVAVTLSGVHTTLVLSGVDKQPGRVDGRRSTSRHESRRAPADDRRDRRYAGRLGRYYDAVIGCIRHCRSVLVLGPGEAKGELRRRLAVDNHDHRVFRFETMGKMTGPQIAARTMDWLEADRRTAPLPRRRSGRPTR